VAAVFVRGRAGIGEFTEEAIKSPDILDIAAKVRVSVDKNIGEKKGLIPAKISITTVNGESFMEQTYILSEGPAKPLPFADYERKFRDCASYAVKPRTKKQIDKVVSLVRHLEQVEDARELVEPLT
jgi:2-methylcitrate dehydratase PrpD